MVALTAVFVMCSLSCCCLTGVRLFVMHLRTSCFAKYEVSSGSAYGIVDTSRHVRVSFMVGAGAFVIHWRILLSGKIRGSSVVAHTATDYS